MYDFEISEAHNISTFRRELKVYVDGLFETPKDFNKTLSFTTYCKKC